ncbi:hypothetical protein GCM10007901_19770 [Dyella acidisoli]|uniref:Uncharacterized protein n=1 Tax=Dyella acidisoli TaxID=1867834 RepID=A0ABQ5XMU0_9GAMM|nr:hypothetical protein GCM10007901_19770 [Dyella acidisoli]
MGIVLTLTQPVNAMTPLNDINFMAFLIIPYPHIKIRLLHGHHGLLEIRPKTKKDAPVMG